jgi:hypothetical protein
MEFIVKLVTLRLHYNSTHQNGITEPLYQAVPSHL